MITIIHSLVNINRVFLLFYARIRREEVLERRRKRRRGTKNKKEEDDNRGCTLIVNFSFLAKS